MNCDEASILMHALIDGELDAGHARELETHIATCAGCAARLREFHELRKMMTPAGLRYTAPVTLRASIEGKLPAPPAAASRRSVIKGFAAGAALSALAASGMLVMVARRDDDRRVLGDVVSAHLRSLQAQHLTAQGFTLLGGRLDYVDAKPVAAIVYRRRVHIINLFCAPAPGSANSKATMESLHGFNVRRWSENGLNLWAVSDINADELMEFGEKFEAALKQ